MTTMNLFLRFSPIGVTTMIFLLNACSGSLPSTNIKGPYTYRQRMEMVTGGFQRSYRVHVPIGYDGSNSLPLVLTAAAQMPTSVPCSECYKLKIQIEENYFSYDEASIRRLLDQSRDLVDQHPTHWHPHYYAGLINVQLGNIVRYYDKNMAYRHYTDALAHIQVAHERSPTNESSVVLADVYGKLASLKTFKMLFFGSRSKSHLIDAFRMGENSPKACLVAGIEMMWTPTILGGGTKRARRFLEKALTAASDWRETDRLIVQWATQAEILANLAQLEILCKNPSQARYYATQALSLVPDYGFVLRDVLPQLN